MNLTALIQKGIKTLGKQEHLATALDLAPSALSRRLNGEIGWQETEINKLLEITDCEICANGDNKKKIENLKETLRIILA